MRYEVYDFNDEVLDATDDLQNAQISAEYDNAKFIMDTETNEIVWGSVWTLIGISLPIDSNFFRNFAVPN